ASQRSPPPEGDEPHRLTAPQPPADPFAIDPVVGIQVGGPVSPDGFEHPPPVLDQRIDIGGAGGADANGGHSLPGTVSFRSDGQGTSPVGSIQLNCRIYSKSGFYISSGPILGPCRDRAPWRTGAPSGPPDPEPGGAAPARRRSASCSAWAR